MQGNRIRCEQGWLSIESQSGNVLLEQVGRPHAAAASAPLPHPDGPIFPHRQGS